jgi:hypothetical protein
MVRKVKQSPGLAAARRCQAQYEIIIVPDVHDLSHCFVVINKPNALNRGRSFAGAAGRPLVPYAKDCDGGVSPVVSPVRSPSQLIAQSVGRPPLVASPVIKVENFGYLTS